METMKFGRLPSTEVKRSFLGPSGGVHNGPQSAKKVQKVNVSDFEFFDVFGSIEVY